MKYSKKLPEKSWFYNKKRIWGKFMKLKPLARKNVYGNSFEKYCKILLKQLNK